MGMKAILTTIALFLTATFAFAEKEGWTTDLEAAFTKAEKEKKSVLVEFTGSDWCPPCKMMAKNVFTKKEFIEKAGEDFILVELDFPNGDKELKKKNEPYAEKYKIEGFPTVILFDSKGKEYERFFASAHPTVEKFLSHIQSAKK
ncbi:hypothetical protein GCM10007100_22170 [Roseibacillus persicicus]|uniref:Thioredoxin domain-containing protein n=2 Tax=Roseibacillus persicicus TaxID=454148 RepID=A0A918TQS0_9BACT|nr:hypothetical protein GCM10007100_22170 [Roseibacillus persicicus]